MPQAQVADAPYRHETEKPRAAPFGYQLLLDLYD